jgi:microcystin-dependent protein
MSDPFIGEIRMFGFDYPPLDWALCNGQSIQISQNQALFALLGVQFGGDGVNTFKLPDFRGRVPVHPSNNRAYQQGDTGGSEYVTLTPQTMPTHTHSVVATNEAADKNGIGSQANRYLGQAVEGTTYGAPSDLVSLSDIGIDPVGESQPHNNMQPYQVLNFSISLQGVFPPRT